MIIEFNAATHVLVPREPTPKMVDATFDDDIDALSHNKRNKHIYRAMIAAAPAAPAQESINDDGHFSALLGDMHPLSKRAVIDFVNENTVPRASIAAPAQPVPDTWTPTAENVNALPKPVRRYIHDLATNCDPQYIIRENAIKRDENEALQKMYRKAAEALNEVVGCFNAAQIEGLIDALAETTDERLKDLVERRLMYALYAAEGVVDEAAQPVPDTSVPKNKSEQQHSMIAALNKVLERNEQDALRYRWLREVGSMKGAIEWNILGVGYQDLEYMDAAIDAAIDAAMQAKGEAS